MSDRPEFSKLESKGLKVRQFGPFHYRVEERFDVFPNDRGVDWAWHDMATGRRGVKPPDQIQHFVPQYLQANPAPTPVAAPVTEAGWWNCAMEGCDFKMRDDGSAESARIQFKHLETH